MNAASLFHAAERRNPTALARFQRPSFVRIVSAFPRSPSGKVLRRVLTASFHLPPPSAPAG